MKPHLRNIGNNTKDRLKKRERNYALVTKAGSFCIVVIFISFAALQTRILSYIPYPQKVSFAVERLKFEKCFLSHAKMTDQSNRFVRLRYKHDPSQKVTKLEQWRGVFWPQTLRRVTITETTNGIKLEDLYYPHHGHVHPMHKSDWIIAWMCSKGHLKERSPEKQRRNDCSWWGCKD